MYMQELTKQREMLYTVELVCHIPNLASNRKKKKNGINETASAFCISQLTRIGSALRRKNCGVHRETAYALRFPLEFRHALQIRDLTTGPRVAVYTSCRSTPSAYRALVRNASSSLT